MTAQPAATTDTPTASSLLPVGAATLTATPTAAPTAAAASPASAARVTPRTAALPQVRRVATTSGMATAVWPIVVASASAATTRWGGASPASTTSAAITSSQLPVSATAATLSRRRANITRD